MARHGSTGKMPVAPNPIAVGRFGYKQMVEVQSLQTLVYSLLPTSATRASRGQELVEFLEPLYEPPLYPAADQVRQLLTELQRPRDERLVIRRSHRLRKATLLQLKREWQHVARVYGLRRHGWGVRGLRALGWPRIDKITLPRRGKSVAQPSAAPIQDQYFVRRKTAGITTATTQRYYRVNDMMGY